MSEALMGCGKCGGTYTVGATHECGSNDKEPPTVESLQKTIDLLMELIKNHSRRIKALEFKVKS